MTSIYLKYRHKRIDQTVIHTSYHNSLNSNRYFDQFIIAMVPLIRYNYKKLHNANLTIDEFEDVCNDVFEQCIKTMNSGVVFADESQTMVYLSSIVKSVIIAKMKYYNNISNVNLIGFENVLLSNAFSSTQILLRIHLKQIMELMVANFNESIRFIGNERNMCIYIFDLMMKEEKVDKKYLSKKYNLDAEFYVNYVILLMKKILYKYKDVRFNDLTSISNEQAIQHNRQKRKNEVDAVGVA